MPGTRTGLAYIYQVDLHVFCCSHACGYQVAVELYRTLLTSTGKRFKKPGVRWPTAGMSLV